jgi:hypothetical protein
MAFVTLEDMKGTVETTVFAELYERSRAELQPGTVIEVRGRVNLREDAEPKLVLSTVKRLGGLEETGGRSVHIDLAEAAAAVSLEEIRDLLLRHPGRALYTSPCGKETAPAPPDPRQAPACARAASCCRRFANVWANRRCASRTVTPRRSLSDSGALQNEPGWTSKPILDIERKIEDLKGLAPEEHPEAAEELAAPRAKGAGAAAARDLREAHPVAAGQARAPSPPAVHARLPQAHRAQFHGAASATAASRTIRPSSVGRGHRRSAARDHRTLVEGP